MSSEFHPVVIVGAGLSGISTACHLKAELPDTDFIILEGRDNLGGTWDLFRYPGIRSDSDMHTLGFDFKPWTAAKAIADGPAILDYLRETAIEHDIERHIRFGHHLQKIEWCSEQQAWTLSLTVDGQPQQLRCNFLLMCAGYFSYEKGFTPEFAGSERFAGRIVHPQHWPEDLDYDDKQIVVIGSGATAVTLLPQLARRAAAVTMLQRSPTYMFSAPDEDVIANTLRKLLPAKLAYRITRWKNIRFQSITFRLARRWPHRMRRFLVGRAWRALGPDYDVDTHFNPAYNPWEQRLCLVPNDDLFDAIKSGQAAVVTDQIDTFTETGIQLQSGSHLDADIIVTATGLQIVALGGVAMVVDGKAVDLAERFTYKGVMLEGVPNLISTFGYLNASWTLKADLVAKYSCRVLAHLQQQQAQSCVPRLRPVDADMQARPWVVGFSSGYLQRVMAGLPKQGDHEPWINPQHYLKDRRRFLQDPLDDGALVLK